MTIRRSVKRFSVVLWAVGFLLAAGIGGYWVAYADRFLPRVKVGGIPLGGLEQEQAVALVRQRLAALQERGIILKINGNREAIALQDIRFSATPEAVVAPAWAYGHGEPWYASAASFLVAPLVPQTFPAPVQFSEQSLESSIADIARLVDRPGKDVRLHIQGAAVSVLFDTQPGMVMDRDAARHLAVRALELLNVSEIEVPLRQDTPHADPASAPDAKRAAERMLSKPLTLAYNGESFTISRQQLGSWILSGYDGDRLVAVLDQGAISRYVATIGDAIDTPPQKPILTLQDGKVTEFLPPRPGRTLEQDKTIALITETLDRRASTGLPTGQAGAGETTLQIPVKVTRPVTETIQGYEGITELIGRATTRFTGSSASRVSNIRNGVKFLTGILIAPGEEFSTLLALGTVDNTTGYLPELVIKENRTIPEFGGGLCQVSTTLFRAVLNAGLPIVQRRNHSFRVSYYEKDGDGKYIGPGLDATIYSPDPDFRFKNDTGSPILIYGFVKGDALTFELYGTSDGRTAQVKGPTLLSETPPGDPIYEDTDLLPAGVTKQVENARPGGTAVATYIVTYPDGEVITQEFRSVYRRWPARYLVGTGPGETSQTSQ